MAPYFRDPTLDDDEEEKNGVQVSSSGVQAGPAGNVTGGGGSPQPATGSRFTNIDNYLKNNNAQAFGQQFGGKVQGTIDQAKNEIDTTAGSVKNQIGSFQPPSKEDIDKTVAGAGDTTSDEDAKRYQGYLGATYQGPNSLSDNPGAQARIRGGADRAATEANLSGNEAGRFSLLDSYFGRPSYNFGEKSLDNLLVQGGGGLDSKGFQNQAAQLGGQARAQEQQISQMAAQKKGDIEAGRLAARQAIGMQDDGTFSGGPMGQIQSDIEARMAAEANRRAGSYNDIRGDTQDDVISNPKTLGTLGLDPGQKLYRTKLEDFLRQGQAPDKYGTASDSDYARYLALSKLAGAEPTYLTADQRKAPRTTEADAIFDKDAFLRKIQDEETDMANESANKLFHYNGGGNFYGPTDVTRDQLLKGSDVYDPRPV